MTSEALNVQLSACVDVLPRCYSLKRGGRKLNMADVLPMKLTEFIENWAVMWFMVIQSGESKLKHAFQLPLIWLQNTVYLSYFTVPVGDKMHQILETGFHP